MPLIDKKQNLVPANGRASDVAARLTEDIASIQQARMMSAFRVQGVAGILYNRLGAGIVCSCKSHEKQVQARTGDKEEIGAGNRVQTNEAKFGVGVYNPSSPDDEFEDIDNFHDAETSPDNALSQWMGDLHKPGREKDGANMIVDISANGEAGQFSPDLDDIINQFDFGSIGFSDVSCAVCFGSGFVGGYSQFRGWRRVISVTQFTSDSTFDLTKSPLSIRAGTHTFTTVLPFGAIILDVFRPMNDALAVPAQILIDGEDVANKRVLNWFDGKPHTITIVVDAPITHFEMQAGLSNESVYFEFPKRTKNQDIALLEKTEPFQIILSPEIPQIDVLDIFAESQSGKILIVQNTNGWNTRNRQFLGWEVTVRVAQPAELWRLLPFRRHVSEQKVAHSATPSKATVVGGLSAGRGQGFSF